MSVQRVTLTAADEKYAPAEGEIDITVVGNEVFISVYKGSLEDLQEGREKQFDVPVLALSDLLAALGAFGDQVHSIRLVRPESE